MTALLFTAPTFRPLSLSGAIMPGAYVQFYEAGTTTPADVYADAALAIPLSNPVVANSDGEFPPIYLDRSVVYRAQIYDANDVLQLDVDPLGTSLDVQPGTILMFFGDETARDAAYPPSLWAVCDGTGGTPDLSGRVPVGMDTGLSPGDTGGSAAASTSAGGDHDHGGTVSAESLTEEQMPTHHHRALADVQSASTEVVGLGNAGAQSIGGRTALFSVDYVDDAGGSEEQVIEDAGDGDPHAHDIAESGTHTHTVSTMPPYCVLWFLMRKAS